MAILGFGLTILLAGCSPKAPYALLQVTGTLKYADGTVPQGEIVQVQFVPAAKPDATAAGPKTPRPPSGDVNKDGTFTLMTARPGDGAALGDYKVIVTAWKSQMKREPLVADKYTKVDSTPLSATVKSGSQKFDFTVEKP